VQWIIDGNNVMGAVADGWWNDPAAAAERLTELIGRWCRSHDDEVILVFDGRIVPAVAQLAGGNLRVEFAGRTARDAADDRIVELVGDRTVDVTVVTSDRGLIGRLPTEVRTVGSGGFRRRIDAC
jgi:predicted RNA-binding protein with PIN domain